jgi:hypothetical protein
LEPRKDPSAPIINKLRKEVSELRTLIDKVQDWKTRAALQLARADKYATKAAKDLTKTDIHELYYNIHQLKRDVVAKEEYDKNKDSVLKEIVTLHLENERLQNRVTTLEAEEWIPYKEFRSSSNGLHANIKVLTNTIALHYNEHLAMYDKYDLRVQPTSHRNLEAMYAKQEEMTEALDALYKSIKEDLLKGTKENLVAEIDFEMKQDQSIHDRIATITKQLFSQEKLTAVMNTQLDEIKSQAKRTLEQHIAQILDPSKRPRNPYNPVDRALKNIHNKIKDMVDTAITNIDEVICGTLDQAIEGVRLSTHNKAQHGTRPGTKTEVSSNAFHATQPQKDNAIPSVTPERTFRGCTVHIKEPPPRREEYYEDCSEDRNGRYRQDRSYNERHRDDRSRYDNYDRLQEEYKRQRDQEYFLKGHVVEASLEALAEDDMIGWYKTFESYCSLHNVPLMPYHQVAKGIDLYPSDQPTEERTRFSRIISLKLNQLHVIKDPTAKSIKNARVGRDDGYGALYTLLAATIPQLQVHKIAPNTGSNKPPE